MSLDQLLSLSQTLKLSPTLLQSMHILQMNTLELAAHLNELALENPTMEYAEGHDSSWEDFSSRVSWLRDTPAPGFDGEVSADLGMVQAETEGLDFLLGEQLARLSLSPPLAALCQYLVEQMDYRGYLDPVDLDGLRRAGVPEDLLNQAVATLQSLEPAGVAARGVGECLALQLRRRQDGNDLAVSICLNHLDGLAAGHYQALAKHLSVTEAEIREAETLIHTLNPDPVGDAAPPEQTEYIRPDAWVAEIDGELRVFVNQWDLPQFQVSQTYLQMLRESGDPEAVTYLKEKVQQTQWVLQCVRRRQNTLETCLSALVSAQEDYFRGNVPAPGPLLRRELADTLGVHPSTVTRTLGHKYIQCRQGLFPTGYFFSRPLGLSLWSEQAVKARLRALISEEDPAHPYSDQALADLLAKEGVTVARRTVFKYRAALGLPNSRRRHK